ncbi:hypothetical protein [Planosporangium mesophilum]|uniref:Uncharacterized protein n=1 Tax=Planosporangium mesophilum TaxID=689768 RepID=A0A8J3THJ5_9ACTN|nr:hypothetical protein [Planosporangium mesophilum]NJC86317.1 hypothetical protein [Planosporangium mesophilum]GII25892.1 hypothetical protein Pme01_54890 [Planosporangium mesophilum]
MDDTVRRERPATYDVDVDQTQVIPRVTTGIGPKRRRGWRLPGALLLVAGTAMVATVLGVAAVHSTSAASAARFVTPPAEAGATVDPEQAADQAVQPDPAPSAEPATVPAPAVDAHTPEPTADPGVHLNDGLSEHDPGQPKQPTHSPEPASNG